ncbi:MAG: hypothetical protein OXI56_01120 [bacterium]|nr:hypothetical protein [bacterium]
MRIPAGSPPDERVTELVSNRDHSPDGQAGNAGHDHAQSFTTGSHSNGYVVRSIDLYFSFVIPGGNRGPTTVVQIWTNSDDNRPSEELATLSGHSRLDSAGSGSTRPFTFSAGERRFVALDEGIHLDPDTTYWVFLDWTPDGNNSPRLRTTTSAEESQAESGWSIGDSSFYRSQGATTWTEWGYSHKLTIDGYPK